MTMRIIMWTLKLQITGYRVLYSESIAGRGIARLISWLDTARQIDCFNRVYFDCYIRVYQSFSSFISKVQPTFGWPWGCMITLINWNTCTQWLKVTTDSLLLQLIIHFHSQSKPTKNNLWSSGLLFIVQEFIIPYQKK